MRYRPHCSTSLGTHRHPFSPEFYPSRTLVSQKEGSLAWDRPDAGPWGSMYWTRQARGGGISYKKGQDGPLDSDSGDFTDRGQELRGYEVVVRCGKP